MVTGEWETAQETGSEAAAAAERREDRRVTHRAGAPVMAVLYSAGTSKSGAPRRASADMPFFMWRPPA